MNTADGGYRCRPGIAGKAARHSTELSSSRSSKTRIKVISTRFPVDFFEQTKTAFTLECTKVSIPSKPQSLTQQPTPKFSSKHNTPLQSIAHDFRIHRSKPQRLHRKDLSESAKRRLKPNFQSEEKICSYMHDVIQLTSSLRKVGKKSGLPRKSLQQRGSIFERENIELPPLVLRNNLSNPQARFFS